MYKYNENTLIHSPGVDFATIESIMKNGIMSSKYGIEHGISVNRNYLGSNLNDTISCIRYLYVNKDVEDSAYNRYVPNGISFLIEGVPFISDKNERFIHRSDEVLVKDFIPKENIKGILVPEELIDIDLEDLPYIREDASSYELVKHRADGANVYITNATDMGNDYNDYYRELYFLSEDANNDSDMSLEERKEEFRDVISDLNYVIGLDYHKCFSKVLGKEDVDVLDIVKYINSKTLNLPIYVEKMKKVKKVVR